MLGIAIEDVLGVAASWAQRGKWCAGGAPDEDGATAVAEAPAAGGKEEAAPEPEAESAAEVAPAEVDSTSKTHTVILPNGQKSVPQTEDELKYWAAQGMQASLSVSEVPAESEPEPVAEAPVDPNEDPLERRIKKVEADSVARAAELAQLKEERAQERVVAEDNVRKESGRKQIDRLITQHAEWADEEDREAIEGTATILHRKAIENGQPITDEQAIQTAAKRLGEKTAAANRAHETDKQKTRETAAEGGRGVAAMFGVPTPAKPRTQAERRASAVEMDDGTADREARTLMREMMNAPAG